MEAKPIVQAKEMENGTSEEQFNAEQAELAILRDRQRREQAALKEINEVLQKHKCQMQPSLLMEGTRVSHTVKVVAL